MCIVTSILTGAVASFLVFLLCYLWKPNIIVSTDIAYNSLNQTVFIKVVNCSKVPIHDVTYELLKCENKGDGIVNVISCKPCKTAISIMNRYDCKDEEGKYAVRLSYGNNENKIFDWLNIDSNHYLLFNITAKHSFSGGIKTVSKKYVSSNIKNGKFETKKSMRILLQD